MPADNEVPASHEEEELDCGGIAIRVVGLLVCLYSFLLGIGMMGDAFKVLGGAAAGTLFQGIKDPIAGLMIGIVATVLVQSSSTSTTIVVGLCAADQLTVKDAIPIIMGANIGTSVTNTLVSMGNIDNRKNLERSFAGATVHDMFNMLSVLVLLPIEMFAQPIFRISDYLVKPLMDSLPSVEKMGDSPIKMITSPVTSQILKTNKDVIYSLSLGQPAPVENTEVFPIYNCSDHADQVQVQMLADEEALREIGRKSTSNTFLGDADYNTNTKSQLSRRLAGSVHPVHCNETQPVWCLNPAAVKQFDKLKPKLTESNRSCEHFMLTPPQDDCAECYLGVDTWYREAVEGGDLVKSGFLDQFDNATAGTIALIMSLTFLCLGLFFLVKLLHSLIMSQARRYITWATTLNDYLAILVGVVITIIVQSSSVTTSALTPLVGIGALPVEKMFPMTLGANIGTTSTSIIASLAELKQAGFQIAMCHFMFNIFGILIWFPFPFMRQVPINAAKLMGYYASFFRWVPVAYILVAFVLLPLICLGISTLAASNAVAGIFAALVFVAAIIGLVYWWNLMDAM